MNGKLYDKALALINRGASPGDVYPLLLEAMDAGDYRAHYALGTWYLYGRHIKVSNKKAVSLFRQAAENDVAEAAFDLAVCYEKGEGVRKDLSKAAAFYLRALRCGDESAAEELRRMFYWGFGVEKNRMIASEFAAFEKPGPEKPGRR
ncbi:tetratricopeptide repeat protein [Stenotrophomonas acidaminiphila]|uniref:tetratricopeptide repeat protein n=1 Tax=Stenotrophomonas acidaminiphila TaxID=128780 RepID=UPI001FAFECD2|nr:tetratricopeptide repeat protein [Stenotrophomonas acidaminiphila]